jgi:HK97 family phage prohead protease
VIRGFASTPAIDRYNDVVDPAAFKKTMAAYMKNGLVLLHHNARTPLGTPTDYEISDKGLWIEASLGTGLHPLDHHEQAWNEIVQRMLKGLSIGFRITKDQTIDPNTDEGKRGAQRRILGLELYEVSVVTIPANRETMFSVAKGLQFGSDAPIDLYGRNYWPDERTIRAAPEALDLYWSGRWPGTTEKALRSLAIPDGPGGGNEGVEGDNPEELAAMAARLDLGVAVLGARRNRAAKE